jgi:hypothetical protein
MRLQNSLSQKERAVLSKEQKTQEVFVLSMTSAWSAKQEKRMQKAKE